MPKTKTDETTSVVDVLRTIRDKHGDLTPEIVLREAKSPKHPLHSRFDWDDSVAAHKWRLEQAGQLLRITYRPDPEKPTDLRAFVAVKGEDSPRSSYVPTEEALADPFTRELTLRQMKREWQSFKRRYDHMAEFAEFVRAEIEGSAA